MSLIKSCIMAFSMYSKIPVPQLKWDERDMKYVIVFFPWVGAVIGGTTCLWGMASSRYEIGSLFYSTAGAAIPLFLSGGIHLDGFMDTMDAFHSYQDRKQKLEILKDAHIGAFSVICLVLYYLVYIGAYSEIHGKESILMLALGFYLSRILSGIGVVCFSCAKREGLLYLFASRSHKKIVRAALFTQLAICTGLFLALSFWKGLAVVTAALLAFGYYRFRSGQELGGITGDTAGCFVTICECVIAVVLAVFSILA